MPFTVCWKSIAPKMEAKTEAMDTTSPFESNRASWFNNTDRILLETPSTINAVEEMTLRTFNWKKEMAW